MAGCLATPQLWREIDWVGDWKDGSAAPPLQTSMARPIHQSEDGIAPRLRLIDFPAANHFLRIPNHQRLLLEMAWFDDGQSISRHFCLFWGLLELDLRCPLHQNGILKCIFIDISAGLNSSLGAKLSYEFLVFFSIEYKSYESCGAVYNEAC